MSFFNFCKVLAAPLMWLIFPTTVYGRENYSRDKAVICCNHYSGLDVAVIGQQFIWGKCYCLAKKELFSHKAIAWFLRKSGAISIDRGEVDVAAFRTSMSVLSEGKQLIVFPEGTRNRPDNPTLQPLLPGAVTFALKGDCDIIPMVVSGKIRPFHRTYLAVGPRLSMAQFKDIGAHAAREAATQYLFETLSRMKADLDATVAAKRRNKRKKSP